MIGGDRLRYVGLNCGTEMRVAQGALLLFGHFLGNQTSEPEGLPRGRHQKSGVVEKHVTTQLAANDLFHVKSFRPPLLPESLV